MFDKVKKVIVTHGPGAALCIAGAKVAGSLTAKSPWYIRTPLTVAAGMGGLVLAAAITGGKKS